MVRTNLPARKSAWYQMNHHICGCYHVNLNNQRQYLPQVSLKSHTSINSQCFSTRLTQTFHNTNESSLAQVRYAFPLYDGVTVNGYTISYAGNTLKGIVQQKQDAKKTYQDAVDRGETAGLLEALPAGVFGVTLGNVPAGTDIIVEITYCGELKHDAGIDGLRYNLPTSIAPRYGEYPGTILRQNAINQGGISITVDIDTGDAPVRRVQSPSHPIAVTMGELSIARKGTSTNSPYTPSQASATLALGTTELGEDFILQLVIDRIGDPQAIIENHPTLPNQRAIMATLVPKFTLKSGYPEIVFIADQSGSMSGGKNDALKAALKIFVKSLPLGVRFNICAFGSTYQFLWPKSQAYNEQNVDTAVGFIDTFTSHYGGTEILQPLTAAFENRLGDLPLEVMLLTDGEIWGEQAVFEFINKQIIDEQVDGRVFALGIGSDVSHTLVEGVARAGNGFAQFVAGSYEDLDQKIVRMLKAALFSHTRNYQLEVHYDDSKSTNGGEDDDDFELVEKVSDCLRIDDSTSVVADPSAGPKPVENTTKSFFDTSVDLEESTQPSDANVDRYAHLPAIATPKILQAPTKIPPLFPFNRTTVFLLLGPQATQQAVKSVTLRATSAEGPLELKIPVRSIGDGSTIHQLAAHKAIQDLEEGRGWLSVATTGSESKPAKQVYASRFDELVERSAVELGVRYQVAGKWTSFVAVNQNGEESGKRKSIDESDPAISDREDSFLGLKKKKSRKYPSQQTVQAMNAPPPPAAPLIGSAFGNSSSNIMYSSSSANLATPLFGSQAGSSTGSSSLFGSAAPLPHQPPSARSASRSYASSLFGAQPAMTQPYAQQQQQQQQQPHAFAAMYAPAPSAAIQTEVADYESEASRVISLDCSTVATPAAAQPATRDRDRERQLRTPAPPRRQLMSRSAQPQSGLFGQAFGSNSIAAGTDDHAKMRALIEKQTFAGAWRWNSETCGLVSIDEKTINMADFRGDDSIAATALVIAFLENKVKEQRGAWEMVVDKAKAWLKSQSVDDEDIAKMIEIAAGYLRSST